MSDNEIKRCGKLSYRELKSGGYQVAARWMCDTDVFPEKELVIPGFITLTKTGVLTVEAGYQWDGASGPVINRKSNMYAGLAHDALYQLMRAGLLGQEWRKRADQVYVELYLENGGWRWIAALDYGGLRAFAGYAAKVQPEKEDKVLTV